MYTYYHLKGTTIISVKIYKNQHTENFKVRFHEKCQMVVEHYKTLRDILTLLLPRASVFRKHKSS